MEGWGEQQQQQEVTRRLQEVETNFGDTFHPGPVLWCHCRIGFGFFFVAFENIFWEE